MVDVFISYKKERREHAERMAAVLEAHGFETFWDYELVVGPSYSQQLMDKLTAARAVVVLWCSGAVQSEFVEDEARRAKGMSKLAPALLEAVAPPLGLGIGQAAMLTGWTGDPDEERLKPLIEAVAALVGRPARRAPNVIALLKRYQPLPALEPLVVRRGADANAPPQRPVAAAGPPPHESAWRAIEGRLEAGPYQRFIDTFRTDPHAFAQVLAAEARIGLLQAWEGADKTSRKALKPFLEAADFSALRAAAQAAWDTASDNPWTATSRPANRPIIQVGSIVYDAAWSPDGARIVTGSEDQTARVWDARTGQALVTLTGHEEAVSSAAFSPDGARIVTGSWDQTARVWDARTGQALITLTGHGDTVWSAAFSPDGARIVTGSDDKTARVWVVE